MFCTNMSQNEAIWATVECWKAQCATNNLDKKGAKTSVKMWTTSFFKSFSKNILLYMSSRLSKIRSIHTYVMPRTVYFGWICRATDIKIYLVFLQNLWTFLSIRIPFFQESFMPEIFSYFLLFRAPFHSFLSFILRQSTFKNLSNRNHSTITS